MRREFRIWIKLWYIVWQKFNFIIRILLKKIYYKHFISRNLKNNTMDTLSWQSLAVWRWTHCSKPYSEIQWIQALNHRPWWKIALPHPAIITHQRIKAFKLRFKLSLHRRLHPAAQFMKSIGGTLFPLSLSFNMLNTLRRFWWDWA